MKNIKLGKWILYIRRNFQQRILSFLGITGSLFIFQACYDTPQDFNPDTLISFEGSVKSEDTRESVSDIEVKLSLSNEYDLLSTHTDENGRFIFDIIAESPDDSYDISINDIDGEKNGSFRSSNKSLSAENKSENITILLKRKN